MKVRIVKDKDFRHIYNVEVKNWWWPFWTEVKFTETLEQAITIAQQQLAHPNVVWEDEK